MRRLIGLAALAMAGCGSSSKEWSRDELTDIIDDGIDASGLEERITALEERQRQLEERQQERAAESAQTVPSRPDGPTFSLLIGQNDSGRSYRSAETCDAARLAVLQQFKEQCQASGALACAEPRVVCVPS